MNRSVLLQTIDTLRPEALAMSDAIFDHPEVGGTERFAGGLLTGFLEKQGFSVERGVGSLETAFRAVWENGTGGPSIGLLCEYDALENFGHGCGHHMQGPAIVTAAAALKAAAGEEPFRIVVYGTPDEEYGNGKITMLENGCFGDIDFALMTHAGPNTTVDVKSLAQRIYIAEYHGRAAHAAIKPEDGRSAVDAMVLSLHGLEILREHVREDIKMHYAILETSPSSNTVPEYARIEYNLRSYSSEYLDQVCRRFEKVMEGAAMMTETRVDYRVETKCDSKVPVLSLNEVIMRHAEELDAPQRIPYRERTGSTDFGNLLHRMPGSCVRFAFVPEGTSSHSQEWLDAGKSERAHNGLMLAARILALTSEDLICNSALRERARSEFRQRLAAEKNS